MKITYREGIKIWDIPEGEHLFRIFGMEEDPSTGALVYHMVTPRGYRYCERFRLLKDGVESSKAVEALSSFAITAYPELTKEFEANAIVNHFIGGKIGLSDPTADGKRFKRFGSKFRATKEEFMAEEGFDPSVMNLTQDNIYPQLEVTKKEFAKKAAERKKAEALARSRNSQTSQARPVEQEPEPIGADLTEFIANMKNM